MKITFYMDALSLWCLLGARSLDETLRELPGVSFDWKLAVLRDGGPLGYTRDEEAYYYRRMEALTGVRMTADWLAGPDTSTYYANAALQAVKVMGQRDLRAPLHLMDAAMVHGRETWRPDVAAALAAEASGLEADEIRALMESDAVREEMAQTQREMYALGMDQRPTIVIENAIPDRAVLMGVWAADAIRPLCAAMLRDEQRFLAFNETNPSLAHPAGFEPATS